MTKIDPLRANDALNQFLKSGRLNLVDVAEELQKRQQNPIWPTFKKRNHKAFHERLLEEHESQLTLFVKDLEGRLINEIWESCNVFPQHSIAAVDQSAGGS